MSNRRSRQTPIPASLQESMDTVEKHYGEGLVSRSSTVAPKNRIPTGSFILDYALMGGWPEGYPVMVYGYHSTSKSTLFLNGVANFQRKHPDRWPVWIDAEGLFDADWAEFIGVDTDRMILSQPESGELTVDLIDAFLRNPDVGLVVLDSIPSCVPTAVIDKSAQDDTMAELARLMGKLCSKYSSALNMRSRSGDKFRPSFWMVNQIRNKVGFVMGSPVTLPGGFQINHMAAIKVWLKLKKKHFLSTDTGEIEDYVEQAFSLEKTKYGSCLGEGEFQLLLRDSEKGVRGHCDNNHQILAYARKHGLVTGSGGHYRLMGLEDTERVFNKLDHIEEFLNSNMDYRDKLAASIIACNRTEKGLPKVPVDSYLWSAAWDDDLLVPSS